MKAAALRVRARGDARRGARAAGRGGRRREAARGRPEPAAGARLPALATVAPRRHRPSPRARRRRRAGRRARDRCARASRAARARRRCGRARAPPARRGRHIGHVPIRTRGTLGGSLAHADPAAELPVSAVALDARIVVRSTNGEREVAADEFLLGPFTTALAPDEMIVAVGFPSAVGRSSAGFREFAVRSGDFAVASAGVTIVRGTTAVSRRADRGRRGRARAAADERGGGGAGRAALSMPPQIARQLASRPRPASRSPTATSTRRRRGTSSRRSSAAASRTRGMSAVGATGGRAESRRARQRPGRLRRRCRLPGQLHARVVRSPLARGGSSRCARTRLPPEPALSPSSPRGRAGRPAAHPTAVRRDSERRAGLQPLLARDSVRYVGEPVAVVVAEDPWTAEDAAELVELDVEDEAEDVAVDPVAAASDDAPARPSRTRART